MRELSKSDLEMCLCYTTYRTINLYTTEPCASTTLCLKTKKKDKI